MSKLLVEHFGHMIIQLLYESGQKELNNLNCRTFLIQFELNYSLLFGHDTMKLLQLFSSLIVCLYPGCLRCSLQNAAEDLWLPWMPLSLRVPSTVSLTYRGSNKWKVKCPSRFYVKVPVRIAFYEANYSKPLNPFDRALVVRT